MVSTRNWRSCTCAQYRMSVFAHACILLWLFACLMYARHPVLHVAPWEGVLVLEAIAWFHRRYQTHFLRQQIPTHLSRYGVYTSGADPILVLPVPGQACTCQRSTSLSAGTLLSSSSTSCSRTSGGWMTGRWHGPRASRWVPALTRLNAPLMGAPLSAIEARMPDWSHAHLMRRP